MQNTTDAAIFNNVADIVRRAGTRSPGADAVMGGSDGLTWGALDAAVDVGVEALSELRVGDRVVLALPTGADLAVALVAVWRAGAVAVPVDPAHPDLAALVARVGAVAIITDPAAWNPPDDALVGPPPSLLTPTRVSGWRAAGSTFGEGHGPPPGDGESRRGHGEPPVRVGGEDLALLARAGREERPVMVSHRALIAGARAVSDAPALGLLETDRLLQVLPLFHVAGIVTVFLPAALIGAAVVIPDASSEAARVDAALETVRAHKVSVLPAEPTLYRRMNRVGGIERALASVRIMTSGASPLDPADFAAMRAATGQYVREGYGISEAASVVTSTLAAPAARLGSVGLPYPGMAVRILPAAELDEGPVAGAQGTSAVAGAHGTSAVAGAQGASAADGATDGITDGTDGGTEGGATGGTTDGVDGAADRADETPGTRSHAEIFEEMTDLADVDGPDGDVGRIAIYGPTLFSGYWPDGTDGPRADGWFVTGDVGYLDDAGELHLVDRADETITVDGFTVYPRQVEDVIVTHPLVADVAVIGLPTDTGERMVAALVAKPGSRPTADDVSDFVAQHLPSFKCPGAYDVVPSLPRTPVGRLDRAAVRRTCAAQRGIELAPASVDRPALTSADPPGTTAGPPGRAQPPGSSAATVRPPESRPEPAAGLDRLGRSLPADSDRGYRSAQDTDDDMF